MDPRHFPTGGEGGNFHSMDRTIFSLLAIELWRDPYESVQILAFWLLLERLGFKRFILFLLSLHPPKIGEFADEAVTCLQCINDFRFVIPPDINVIPLTSSIFNNKISLQYFHENRATMARELQSIITEICAKALPDLIDDALRKHATFDALTDELASLGFVDEKPRSNHRAGTSTQERAVFITFSRGYPVSEAEVRSFFTSLFGECVEAFYMQSVNSPFDQPLYAQVIFSNPATVDLILNGAVKAKFAINGKHMWVRRFVQKFRNFP
ncbi:OLC1v1037878C1 [Oldenlandia corymbosa var. corymbosa]|uniref:OLC1v1037878C1 n=1 Tax=Oldenlandia corymbosa var. corymbosa TaxID=529605 RepID=A0AAV1CZM8_OLDCO|nr:OLC1v1037878C1 [Oldenlandia corymbosa var. corymbosa]